MLLKTLFSTLIFIFTLTSLAEEVKVHEHHLPNGLKILVKEDHRMPVVHSQIWYRVGGADEPNGLTGISHVLEHLLFKGTENYPEGFDVLINEHGGNQNASTGADFTAYYQQFPSEHLELSLQIESERMKKTLFDNEKFEKERAVVIEERRLRTDDNPQAILFERFNAVAYRHSPYRQPVVGWMNDLENLTLDDAKDWYKIWYTPNNAILTVVGAVEPQTVFQLAEKHFAELTPSKLPEAKPLREPKALGQRTVEVRIPAELPYFMMGFNTPSLVTAENKKDVYALLLIEALLSANDSARLPKHLERELKIASHTGANYNAFSRFDTLFTIAATPTPDSSSEQIQGELITQIEQLKTTSVPEEELNRAKIAIKTREIYAQDSLTSQSYRLGIPEIIGESWQIFPQTLEGVEQITPEEIQTTAQKYLQIENMTTGYLVPLVNPPS